MFVIALLLLTSPQAQPVPQQSASGTFDVSIKPLPGDAGPVGTLDLTKTYHGDLEATSTGRMLGAGAPDTGTASYVVLEQVTGALAGRKGGFILQHHGWMHGGRQRMQVSIAPGSGTGELAGIGGTMTIAIEGKVHRYVLSYTLK